MRLIGMLGATLLVPAVVTAQAFPQQDRCSAILSQGYANIETSFSSHQLSEYYHLLQCTETYRDRTDATRAGIAATVPVYGVMVPVNGTWTEDHIENWRKKSCSDEERLLRRSDIEQRTKVTISTVSQHLFNQCMEILYPKAGLQCGITTTDEYVFVRLNYVPANDDDKANPRLKEIAVEGTTRISPIGLMERFFGETIPVGVLTSKEWLFRRNKSADGCVASAAVRIVPTKGSCPTQALQSVAPPPVYTQVSNVSSGQEVVKVEPVTRRECDTGQGVSDICKAHVACPIGYKISHVDGLLGVGSNPAATNVCVNPPPNACTGDCAVGKTECDVTFYTKICGDCLQNSVK